MSLRDRINRRIWQTITPVFPSIRDTLLKYKIIWHEPGRQRYHLGTLAPGETKETLQKYLHAQGFEKNIIAWVDPGEILSMRKNESFHHHFHVRLFDDGEIRGHYEQTPEARPIAHFREIGMEAKTAEFENFLGGKLVRKNDLP